MSINSEITRLQNAKTAIQTSIQNKGQVIPAGTKLDGFSTYIDQITGGGAISLQDKTATPSVSQQIVVPDSGYNGLSSVTISGDANLVSPNIRKDTTIFGVTGTLEEGSTVLQSKSVTPTASTQTINPDSGYDGLSSVTVNGDQNLKQKNIKKGVTLFGVLGTYGTGMDISGVGETVTVEAAGAVQIGDKFQGTAIEGVSKQIVSSSNGNSFAALSADFEVGIVSQTFNASSTSMTFHFKNEQGSYDAVNVLFDTTGLRNFLTTTGLSSFNLSNILINEDGSIAVGIFENGSGNKTKTFILIANIDTDNRTVRIRTDTQSALYFSYSETGYSGWHKYHTLSNLNAAFLIKNYLYLGYMYIEGTSTTSSSTVTRTIYPFYYISDTGLVLSYIGSLNPYQSSTNGYTIDVPTNFPWVNNNEFLVVGGYTAGQPMYPYAYAIKIRITRNEVVETASVRIYYRITGETYIVKANAKISKNGRYIAISDGSSTGCFTNLYPFDPDTMTIGSSIKYIGMSHGVGISSIPTDDGAYLICGDGTAYSVVSGAVLSGSGGSVKRNTYVNEHYWNNGSNLYTIAPSSNAEYLITRLGGTSTTSGKVYGICTENLYAGQTGEAQLLFTTPAASE